MHAAALPARRRGEPFVKLKFVTLDGRGNVFQASVAAAEEQAACEAFDQWCADNLPTPGELWSRIEVERAQPVHRREPVRPGRRLLVLFSDESLARRFRGAWC